MAKTKAEMRNRALIKTGKLVLGQTPDGASSADMEDVYNQVYSRLENKGMVTWSSTDSVPDEFVEDIVSLMAFERSEGVPEARYVRLANDANRAFINISATISGKWTNPRKVTDY